MSILDALNLEDVPELVTGPSGEHEVRLVKISIVEPEGKDKRIQAIFSFVGKPEYDNIFHNVVIPTDDMTEAKAMTLKRMIKELLRALGAENSDVCENSPKIGTTLFVLLASKQWEGKEYLNITKFFNV